MFLALSHVRKIAHRQHQRCVQDLAGRAELVAALAVGLEQGTHCDHQADRRAGRNGKTDGRKNGPTDIPTDRLTDQTTKRPDDQTTREGVVPAANARGTWTASLKAMSTNRAEVGGGGVPGEVARGSSDRGRGAELPLY